MEIHIDLAKLQALQLLAGQNDVRPYLNGVYVEATATQTRLAATNGHIMGLHLQAIPPDFANKGVEWETLILPNEVIAKCKLQKGVSNIGTVLIDQTANPKWGAGIEGEPLTINAYTLRLWDGTLIPFKPCDGKFPDFRRVIPAASATQGEGAQFNPAYLAQFVKAVKLLGDRDARIQMQFNAEGPIRIACKDPAFIGVLMPQKAMLPKDGISFDQPTWPAAGADHAG